MRDSGLAGGKGNAATAIGSVAEGTQGTFDPTQPYTVYDLSGRVVTGDAQHGVYVVKQGKNIFKVMR